MELCHEACVIKLNEQLLNFIGYLMSQVLVLEEQYIWQLNKPSV